MKAQVSIFIIIAVVLVFGLALFFLLRPPLEKNISPEVKEIHDFVQGCVATTAEDAVYQIGETGGYFYSPNLSVENIAYYYYEEQFFVPTKEIIEDEIEKYIDTMLYFCTENFASLPQYEIGQEKIETKAVIDDDGVFIEIIYPLSIRKEEQTFSLEQFSYKVNARLGKILLLINEIEESQKLDKNGWCINCISNSAEEHDMYIHMKDYDEETVLFYIIDERSRVKEDAYWYTFAHRYEN